MDRSTVIRWHATRTDGGLEESKNRRIEDPKTGGSRCGLGRTPACGRRNERDDDPEAQAPLAYQVFVFPDRRRAQPRAARSDQPASFTTFSCVIL
jgi:hypothetical protein